MANRKDYTEIKKRRNYLPDFMVNWNRLPEYLSETNQEVLALQVSNTMVGYINFNTDEINQGTSFIIGKKYNVSNTETGDDFSNIGWIEDGTDFIATNTTPNNWTNSSEVIYLEEQFEIIYNDIDSNVSLQRTSQTMANLNITNGGFVQGKTYPTSSFNSSLVTNSNQVSFNMNTGTVSFFKIEVYV
jgi:hypothetical protein